MGFEFKGYAVLTVLVCCLWALVVSAFTSVDDLGEIKLNSELPRDEQVTTNFSESPIKNEFESMAKVLNFALPLSLVAIVLLVITYGTNPVGMKTLCFLIILYFFTYSKTMGAADLIRATHQSALDAKVWWM
jgi:hypothetical protein